MQTFANQVIKFYQNLSLEIDFPGIGVLNPFHNKGVLDVTRQFYTKFYSDRNPRIFLFGINPGRFGAGVTGIPFTDPINLEERCGIVNSYQKKHELSSQFIYEMIENYGGPENFFSRFYITAVSPLGFVRDGKNLNYYDDRSLQEHLSGFIHYTITEQMKFGAIRSCCICIGGNKNFKFLDTLNLQQHYFDKVLPIEHPRFIMQYRRKALDQYVKKYITILKKCEAGQLF
nr:DUF4918 family protein [Bacteroidota bacterium]